MKPLNITCVEKHVLLDQPFDFQFPVQYTEYQQLNQEQLYQQVHQQDVIIASSLHIDERVLANNPQLKLLALCSTGYNHVDLALLQAHHVKVCNVRNYASDSIAEHCFCLILQLTRNMPLQIQAVRHRQWSQSGQANYLAAPMHELKGKTLTIIGKGDVGLALARMAQAFGLQVVFAERKHARTCRAGYTAFEQAVQQADILSLHCELNAETKQLIDAQVLSLMKPTGILINAGRGELINDEDLIQAIQEKRLAGFAADVLNQEPPDIDHPLLRLQDEQSNVLLTGHIAWRTEEAQKRLFCMIENNINSNMQGCEQNLVYATSAAIPSNQS